MAVPETPAKVLDATLYTRTLVGEDVSMKPKMKQPQTEATEAEAHEAARRWSREKQEVDDGAAHHGKSSSRTEWL